MTQLCTFREAALASELATLSNLGPARVDDIARALRWMRLEYEFNIDTTNGDPFEEIGIANTMSKNCRLLPAEVRSLARALRDLKKRGTILKDRPAFDSDGNPQRQFRGSISRFVEETPEHLIPAYKKTYMAEVMADDARKEKAEASAATLAPEAQSAEAQTDKTTGESQCTPDVLEFLASQKGQEFLQSFLPPEHRAEKKQRLGGRTLKIQHPPSSEIEARHSNYEQLPRQVVLEHGETLLSHLNSIHRASGKTLSSVLLLFGQKLSSYVPQERDALLKKIAAKSSGLSDFLSVAKTALHTIKDGMISTPSGSTDSDPYTAIAAILDAERRMTPGCVPQAVLMNDPPGLTVLATKYLTPEPESRPGVVWFMSGNYDSADTVLGAFCTPRYVIPCDSASSNCKLGMFFATGVLTDKPDQGEVLGQPIMTGGTGERSVKKEIRVIRDQAPVYNYTASARLVLLTATAELYQRIISANPLAELGVSSMFTQSQKEHTTWLSGVKSAQAASISAGFQPAVTSYYQGSSPDNL